MVSWLVFFTSQHHPPEHGFIANMISLICEPCMDHQNAIINQNAQETGIKIIGTLRITPLQQENTKFYYNGKMTNLEMLGISRWEILSPPWQNQTTTSGPIQGQTKREWYRALPLSPHNFI